MRLPIVAALAFVTAACTQPAADRAAPAPPEAAVEPVTVPTPPADEPFIGRWAVSADYCRTGAWTFRKDGVGTAGEVSCSWDRIDRTPAGYSLPGECRAQGEAKPDTVVIAMDGPDAMTVEAQVWDRATKLIRCPAEG